MLQSETIVLKYGIKCDTEDKDPRKTQLFFVHDKAGEGKFSDIKVAGSVFHRNFSFRKGWALGPSLW
jgi:hypothetical protein